MDTNFYDSTYTDVMAFLLPGSYDFGYLWIAGASWAGYYAFKTLCRHWHQRAKYSQERRRWTHQGKLESDRETYVNDMNEKFNSTAKKRSDSVKSNSEKAVKIIESQIEEATNTLTGIANAATVKMSSTSKDIETRATSAVEVAIDAEDMRVTAIRTKLNAMSIEYDNKIIQMDSMYQQASEKESQIDVTRQNVESKLGRLSVINDMTEEQLDRIVNHLHQALNNQDLTE